MWADADGLQLNLCGELDIRALSVLAWDSRNWVKKNVLYGMQQLSERLSSSRQFDALVRSVRVLSGPLRL